MTWFVAHIVIGFLIEDVCEGIPAWENVVLFEADSAQEVDRMAQQWAESECRIDDKLEVNGQKAVRVFAGVRKISEIMHPEFGSEILLPHHINGLEISFSEFIVDTIENLMKLGVGEYVKLLYTAR